MDVGELPVYKGHEKDKDVGTDRTPGQAGALCCSKNGNNAATDSWETIGDYEGEVVTVAPPKVQQGSNEGGRKEEQTTVKSSEQKAKTGQAAATAFTTSNNGKG